ncbi:RNA recognition motif domain [Macleaya cordata]|uniref:RNA recognition motif domain n=1 Tax=Macleaya cordata TaxID=56857 RepID=A0A200QLC4_MACCD|nr:RNA recognition motif domain [Macleaya cordata]
MDDMAGYYPPPPPPPSSGLHHHNNPPPPYPYYPHPPSQPQPQHHSQFPHWYHHHHQQHQQHQPFAPSYPPGVGHHHPPHSDHGSEDDVRTLFIAGLPEDVKTREIYNLFREFPGYQSSKLRSASQNSQAFGFAVFADRQSAVAALQALNGMVFDLEKQSTLYIDLAKSNSRTKRSRTDDGRLGFADKKVRGSASFSRGPPDSGVGSNIHMPGMGNSAYNITAYPTTQRSFALLMHNFFTITSLRHHGPPNSNPCPTLFVANLGPTCTEQELNQVFSRCPGFLKLKMQNKNGAPVAFVDFQDVASSTAALNNLQDTVLYSSTGEGMRLEYPFEIH